MIALVTTWLGIWGPLFEDGYARGFLSVVQNWQTLIAALIALAAAIVAWKNTTRQVRHAAELEQTRRSRKQIALRATLALNLSSLTDYASRSTQGLDRLLTQCVGAALPGSGVFVPEFTEVPEKIVSALAEFIEFSESLDVTLFQELLARLQIHHARTRSLWSEINVEGNSITKIRIESLIIDAASIHAAAGATFNYARRKTEDIPSMISWEDVNNALSNLRIWDHDYPEIHRAIERRLEKSTGPWER